jgi:hypothetical protein
MLYALTRSHSETKSVRVWKGRDGKRTAGCCEAVERTVMVGSDKRRVGGGGSGGSSSGSGGGGGCGCEMLAVVLMGVGP